MFRMMLRPFMAMSGPSEKAGISGNKYLQPPGQRRDFRAAVNKKTDTSRASGQNPAEGEPGPQPRRLPATATIRHADETGR